MEEKTLEDYFKESSPKYNKKNSYSKEKHIRYNKKPSKLKDYLQYNFVYDTNVDLNDQTNVLYRKNFCIRNIISILNLVFILFSFIGISKSNYIIVIVFWLLLTGLSQTIRYMLKRKQDDYSHQTVIMYLQCLFVIVSAVFLYVKVYLGFVLSNGADELNSSQVAVTQSAYFLILLSIIIMSLYQDTKLLRAMFIWSFLIMTIINLTAVHPELYKNASSIKELLDFITAKPRTILTDILLRTIVFLVFYIVLYSACHITYNTSEKRRSEVSKRMDVETDFKSIVQSVFEAVKVYNQNQDALDQRISSRKVEAVTKELCNSLNYDSNTTRIIARFSTVHVDRLNELNIDSVTSINDSNYEEILDKTKTATEIIKRLQLSKRAEDIVCQVFTSGADSRFVNKMKVDTLDSVSNIILISEIYQILRSDRSYKKELNHMRATELIVNDFYSFFNQDVVVRFQKFHREIQAAYERA